MDDTYNEKELPSLIGDMILILLTQIVLANLFCKITRMVLLLGVIIAEHI